MPDSAVPYLNMMRTLLETSLRPSEPSAAKYAKYSHRMLTMLALRLEKLPAMQADALRNINGVLDQLVAELKNIDGNMILVPQLMRHVRKQPDFAAALPFLQQAVRMLAEQQTPARLALQQQLAKIMLALEVALHQAAEEGAMKPPVAEQQTEALTAAQRARLTRYLRDRFPSDGALEIGGVRLIIGGGSKKTLIVELLNTVKLDQRIVLRIDNAGGVVDSKVVDEYDLIQTVAKAGMKVAQPILCEPDASVLGAPFLATSCIEGHNIGDWEEVTEPSREFALDLADTLAKLHAIPEKGLRKGFPGVDVTTRERICRELASFENSWRAYGESSIAMEQAYAWLKSHLQFAEGQRSILHCDVGCHNMLGHDGRLTALLDWETAVVGNPAQDISYVKHTVVQMLPWDEFLAAYAKAGGTVPSEGELDFYTLWRNIFTMHYEYMARSFTLGGDPTGLIIAYSSQHVYQYCNFELHKTLVSLYERYE